MHSDLPAELVYGILDHLHITDISQLLDAVRWDKRLRYVVGLPCLKILQPIADTSKRRCRYEELFGKAQDIVNIVGNEVWEAGWTHELLHWRLVGRPLISRQMRHEHAVAFLHLNETLEWLPPVSPRNHKQHSSDAYYSTLTPDGRESICRDTSQLGLIVPASFIKFISDTRLMQRLPYSFWLPQHSHVKKAADYVENGRNGYMIDFCHEHRNGRQACMWSLYMEPGLSASHCVISRPLRSDTGVRKGRPSARLVGITFELWLANEFFLHWMKCGLEPCGAAHMVLDAPLSACLRRYVSYNCMP